MAIQRKPKYLTEEFVIKQAELRGYQRGYMDRDREGPYLFHPVYLIIGVWVGFGLGYFLF